MNMISKKLRSMYQFIVSHWVVILALCLLYHAVFTFLLLTQTVPSYRGFGVDSNEYLYIGKIGTIEVYKDDVLVDKISPQTSRGYSMTIIDDIICEYQYNCV